MKVRPLHYLSRTIWTISLTFLFAFAFAFRRLWAPSAGPRLLRRYLERAGGAFVKLGQILAMRYDLLPADYCQELTSLLDQLPPSCSVDIVQRIERDLGKKLGNCFLTFDEGPISSASVAQVYAATLLDGQK